MKRMMNQDIFEKIYGSYIDQKNTVIKPKLNPPLNASIEAFQAELTRLNQAIQAKTNCTLIRIATTKDRILKTMRGGLSSCNERMDIKNYSNSYFFDMSSSNAFLVEMRGIEPLSESPPKPLSTSVVNDLGFPSASAH